MKEILVTIEAGLFPIDESGKRIKKVEHKGEVLITLTSMGLSCPTSIMEEIIYHIKRYLKTWEEVECSNLDT